MKSPLHTAFVVLATVAALFATSSAFAQWGWTEKDGRRIYSDQAPGSEVPAKNIFKRPAGAQAKAKAEEAAEATAVSAAGTASAPTGTASAPKGTASAAKASGKETELDKKVKEKETAEAAKKKAEADKFVAAQAENCSRARKGKAAYDSGIRMTTTNAKGEREYLDDAARAVETKRLEGIIAADCQ